MPVKFVVQRKVKTLSGIRLLDAWRDTVWTSLDLAREKFPEHTYREVMTQW